jgi:hypothetical protein
MVCLIKTLFSLFTTVAFVYTTSSLVLQPLASRVARLTGSHEVSELAEYLAWPSTALLSSRPYQIPTVLASSNSEREWLQEAIFGHATQLPLPHSTEGWGSSNPVFLKENLFLSRAFSQAMQPSKIIPFYYRASGTFPRDDITIATLVTSNRFEVLARLVQRYQGL